MLEIKEEKTGWMERLGKTKGEKEGRGLKHLR